MNRTFTRRIFTGAVFAVPFAAKARPGLVQPAQLSAAIGDTQDAFDLLFGAGREEGDYTLYDFSSQGKAAYWVSWDTNGYAQRIAIDFSPIPGGLPFEPGLLGQSQFLPHDASINLAGNLTDMHVGETGFYIAQHHSDDVQAATGRSGNILVVDQRAIPGDGPNNPNFTRTRVAMETFEVNPIVPTGALPNIEAGPQWNAVFGESWGTQRGSMPTNPPLPGRWMFYGDGIDVLLDNPIHTTEAAQWVSDFLPTSLGSMGTTYWLPSPADYDGLRVCVWPHGNGMSTVALQLVHGTEGDGTVDRFMINTLAPATV